jgi:hypothetical protein
MRCFCVSISSRPRDALGLVQDRALRPAINEKIVDETGAALGAVGRVDRRDVQKRRESFKSGPTRVQPHAKHPVQCQRQIRPDNRVRPPRAYEGPRRRCDIAVDL